MNSIFSPDEQARALITEDFFTCLTASSSLAVMSTADLMGISFSDIITISDREAVDILSKLNGGRGVLSARPASSEGFLVEKFEDGLWHLKFEERGEQRVIDCFRSKDAADLAYIQNKIKGAELAFQFYKRWRSQ